jgi:hypothetical protein
MKWPPLKSHLSLRLIIGVYSNIFHEFLLCPISDTEDEAVDSRNGPHPIKLKF